MSRTLVLLILSLIVTACRRTFKDYDREVRIAFNRFMTGDVHTAKAALLEHEKILADHQARGNRSIDYRGARVVLYGNLFGICDFMGQTNEAKIYLLKYNQKLGHDPVTYEKLVTRAKKHHERLQPKWREPK